jgi:hypothetical protein
MRYSDFDDAIDLHNAVPQGLSFSTMTTDLREAERFMSASGSDCGVANVNMGPSAPRLAVRSAARRTPATDENRVRMRGSSICGGQRTRSIIRTGCRSRKASSSISMREEGIR